MLLESSSRNENASAATEASNNFVNLLKDYAMNVTTEAVKSQPVLTSDHVAYLLSKVGSHLAILSRVESDRDTKSVLMHLQSMVSEAQSAVELFAEGV